MKRAIYLFSVVLIISAELLNKAKAQGEPALSDSKMISLEIIAKGFKSDSGQAILNVFKTSDGFPGNFSKAYKSYKGNIQERAVMFNIEIPMGVYAFSCVHDENKNEGMDKNFIGIPKEGAGLSNYKEKGFPSFNKAKVLIDKNTSRLQIKINYL
jgi:uncharacterized protein (DUF2141 family)